MGACAKLQLLVIAPFLLSYLVDAATSVDYHVNSTEPVVEAGANTASFAAAAILDCGAECRRRCSLSGRPRLCQRACGSCCLRCNCVPPGTYGNYDACPCYGSLTTHGNRRKCP